MHFKLYLGSWTIKCFENCSVARSKVADSSLNSIFSKMWDVLVFVSRSHTMVWKIALINSLIAHSVMASEETSGEYEHKFVDIPDDLICVVCQFVAREPHQVDCCGKIFCKLCIETANERFGKCPNCRGTANSFVDRRSARQIKALKISCKNEEKGCSWVGRLEDYEQRGWQMTDILPVLVSCFKASIYLMDRNGSRTVKVIRPTI